MTVFSSNNGGLSWEPRLLLDANTSEYSSVISLPNGSFAVQYDVGRTHMHRCIEPPAGHGCGEEFSIFNIDG
jgi:hypothetical protein